MKSHRHDSESRSISLSYCGAFVGGRVSLVIHRCWVLEVIGAVTAGDWPLRRPASVGRQSAVKRGMRVSVWIWKTRARVNPKKQNLQTWNVFRDVEVYDCCGKMWPIVAILVYLNGLTRRKLCTRYNNTTEKNTRYNRIGSDIVSRSVLSSVCD